MKCEIWIMNEAFLGFFYGVALVPRAALSTAIFILLRCTARK
jgi:hypothetical protein